MKNQNKVEQKTESELKQENFVVASPVKKPGEFRPGKTRRDRENGSIHRNAANKAARAEWNNETTGKRSNDGKNFPYGTCNGKRNRPLKERASCKR